MVEQLWRNDQPQIADQWLLRIRDILGELLSGVTQGDDPLRKTIADLYVFMILQVQQLERTRSYQTLAGLKNLLAIESETWRQVVEKEANGELFADAARRTPSPFAIHPSEEQTFSSLSLEA